MTSKCSVTQSDSSLHDDSNHSLSFGAYLRNVRKERQISVRQLAKAVNKTPTYISDIENGNNKPPDKALLLEILSALDLQDSSRIRDTLYDLAASERDDIPIDIKELILNNPELILLLRTINSSSDKEKMINLIDSTLRIGGNKYDAE